MSIQTKQRARSGAVKKGRKGNNKVTTTGVAEKLAVGNNAAAPVDTQLVAVPAGTQAVGNEVTATVSTPPGSNGAEPRPSLAEQGQSGQSNGRARPGMTPAKDPNRQEITKNHVFHRFCFNEALAKTRLKKFRQLR